MSYQHLEGEWVLCHGAARLHYRGKLLRVEEGPAATRLVLHPAFCVYRWDQGCNPPTFEVARDTTPEKPAVLIAEHFTCVALQPSKWPKDEPAAVEAPKRARR